MTQRVARKPSDSLIRQHSRELPSWSLRLDESPVLLTARNIMVWSARLTSHQAHPQLGRDCLQLLPREYPRAECRKSPGVGGRMLGFGGRISQSDASLDLAERQLPCGTHPGHLIVPDAPVLERDPSHGQGQPHMLRITFCTENCQDANRARIHAPHI